MPSTDTSSGRRLRTMRAIAASSKRVRGRRHATKRSERSERAVSLTPEQALQLAIERHKADRLDEAETIYRVLLERWPDHADVLNHMGVLLLQRGSAEEALALLRRAAEAAPGAAGIWNNLGNALMRLREIDEAEQAFRRSIELEDNPQAEANLSRVLRRREKWAESEAACRRAIELAPDFGDAWHNLALSLIAQQHIDEGIAASHKATLLLPPHKRRRDSYARALVANGELEKAASVYRQWLKAEPGHAYATHHLAACTGQTPKRASDDYVELVFDGFASTFDAKLAQLGYRAPELVVDALRKVLPAPEGRLTIADLGCGTGLCGPLVKGWSGRLTGCDLSAAMLEQAQARGVYDEIEKAELVRYLRDHPNEFDVLISADTLCYFGDLQGVAAAARAALREGGHLVFTVEALDAEAEATAGYRILGSGRYAHHRSYVERALEAGGLRCESIVGEVLRNESNRPVHGWLVTAVVDAAHLATARAKP